MTPDLSLAETVQLSMRLADGRLQPLGTAASTAELQGAAWTFVRDAIRRSTAPIAH